MLDAELKTQLQGLPRAHRRSRSSSSPRSTTARSPAETAGSCSQEIAALSDQITLVADGDDAAQVPSFAHPAARARDVAVRFAGMPMGHEFTSLVLALLQVGGHPPKDRAGDCSSRSRRLEGEFRFETYFSLILPELPGRGAGAEPDERAQSAHPPRRDRRRAVPGRGRAAREVMAVPTVFLNGEPFGQGRMGLEQILAKLDTGAAARAGRDDSPPRRRSTC